MEDNTAACSDSFSKNDAPENNSNPQGFLLSTTSQVMRQEQQPVQSLHTKRHIQDDTNSLLSESGPSTLPATPLSLPILPPKRPRLAGGFTVYRDTSNNRRRMILEMDNLSTMNGIDCDDDDNGDIDSDDTDAAVRTMDGKTSQSRSRGTAESSSSRSFTSSFPRQSSSVSSTRTEWSDTSDQPKEQQLAWTDRSNNKVGSCSCLVYPNTAAVSPEETLQQRRETAVTATPSSPTSLLLEKLTDRMESWSLVNSKAVRQNKKGSSVKEAKRTIMRALLSQGSSLSNHTSGSNTNQNQLLLGDEDYIVNDDPP
jgi:hypothetical protein